jgi:hypothetical protein
MCVHVRGATNRSRLVVRMCCYAWYTSKQLTSEYVRRYKRSRNECTDIAMGWACSWNGRGMKFVQNYGDNSSFLRLKRRRDNEKLICCCSWTSVVCCGGFWYCVVCWNTVPFLGHPCEACELWWIHCNHRFAEETNRRTASDAVHLATLAPSIGRIWTATPLSPNTWPRRLVNWNDTAASGDRLGRDMEGSSHTCLEGLRRTTKTPARISGRWVNFLNRYVPGWTSEC